MLGAIGLEREQMLDLWDRQPGFAHHLESCRVRLRRGMLLDVVQVHRVHTADFIRRAGYRLGAPEYMP